MWHDRTNQVIIALVTLVSSVQFLPHWFTRLICHQDFQIGHLLLAVFVTLLMVGFTIGCFLAWLMTDTYINRRMRNRSRFLTFLFSWCLVAVIGWVNVAFSCGLPMGSFARSFDSKVWKQPSSQYTSGDISERQKMLGDVIHKVVRNNTKEGIFKLLGPSNGDYFTSSGRDLIYCMGSERGNLLALDSEWLLIWFDANGRTMRYEIWSD